MDPLVHPSLAFGQETACDQTDESRADALMICVSPLLGSGCELGRCLGRARTAPLPKQSSNGVRRRETARTRQVKTNQREGSIAAVAGQTDRTENNACNQQKPARGRNKKRWNTEKEKKACVPGYPGTQQSWLRTPGMTPSLVGVLCSDRS